MSAKARKFAAKYGKKYGGVLTVEGARSPLDTLKEHPELAGVEVPDKIVSLSGYVQYSSVQRINKGAEGKSVTTGYVVGLALNEGALFAITPDMVYKLTGPWCFDIIIGNPFLNGLWEEVKIKALAEISGSSKSKG